MIPASIKKLRDFSGDFAMHSASFLVEAGRILPIGVVTLATLRAVFAERFAMTSLRVLFRDTPILYKPVAFSNQSRTAHATPAPLAISVCETINKEATGVWRNM